MMNTSNNETNPVKRGLNALSKMSPVFRWIVIISLAVAAVAGALGLTSCGNMSRISIKSDPNNISISVSQSTNDSTAVNVNVNPTLRLYEGKKNETSSGKDGQD